MKQEIERQLFHLVTGTVFVLVVHFVGVRETFYLSLALLALGAVIAWLVKKGVSLPFIHKALTASEREHEKGLPGFGAFKFVSSVALLTLLGVLGVFRQERVVLGALLVLAYGDSFSTWVGKNFGRTKTANGRTLEGTVGGILASSLILSLFFEPFTALTVSVLGMLAEYLPFDDNYSIPLVAAAVLTLLLGHS